MANCPTVLTHRQFVRLLVFSFCALLAGSSVRAQTNSGQKYLIHTWQTDNGLPQNWVSSIAQTPDGYLWIGTRYGGLARFDGVRFVVFNQQNTPALKDVQVEHLSVDAAGRLWVIMGNESIAAWQEGGFHLYRQPRSRPRLRAESVLSCRSNLVLFAGEFPYLAQLNLDQDTNGWTLLDPHPKVQPQIESFVEDENGVVWFVTQARHLAKYQDHKFERQIRFPGQTGTVVVDVALDARRQLWMTTRRHVERWNGNAFEDCTPTNGPPPTSICAMAFSGDGGLWVLEQDHLRKCLNGQWVAEAQPWHRPVGYPLNPSQFQLYGDAQGNAWLISSGNGLWHVTAKGAAYHLTKTDGLPSEFITCWFQDSEGDVWVGTAGGGIARIRESIFRVYGEEEGLPGKVVRSVCVDTGGKVWAGTLAGGLASLQGGKFAQVEIPRADGAPIESITVVPDQTGGLWVGSLNHGMMRLDAGQTIPVPTAEQFGRSVRVLYSDRHDQLWVGSLVDLFLRTNGVFKQLGAAAGFVDNQAVGALAEDETGGLWIGTGPGDLWKYDGGHFTCFTPPAGWPSARISALLPDANGVVWVGTLGGGLLRFHDGKFTRCTTDNRLPDNNISQLLDSHDGYLWAGTYAGIFRANKADLAAVAAGREKRVSCREYGRYDGLPSLECSSGFQPSCWRAPDGQLWFTTANGVVSVNPLNLTPNRVPPRVIIEEMLINGKPGALPIRSGGASVPAPSTQIQIEPGRHYVQFRFTGLNFAAPDGVRFRVKLDGVDADWHSIGGQRFIGYGPLLPGAYRFHVMACNNEGVWNEAGDTLAFTILPHFWETWWFKAGLITAALTALGLVVALAQRRRYRRKLEIVQRQREMERERTRIARDLHDELGTSLTQIGLLSALANRDQTPPSESREIIQQVRDRAREMVTALDEIVWAVNPKNDSLLELVNYLGHFAEEFFRPTGIRCRLDIPKELPAPPLSAELRHHLFLAFKAATNNVARHSGATEVRLRVEAPATGVVICVEDNGRGFATSAASGRRGNGLGNMKQRLENEGGRTEIKSAPGQGTVVSFHLPPI